MKRRSLPAVNGPGLALVGALLLAWEAMLRSGALALAYLPRPTAIAQALWALTVAGPLPAHTLHTLMAMLLGWGIAAAIGIALGLLLGLSATARRFSWTTVELLRPLPGIAFLPVALLIFNFSLQTELTVIVYPTVWPILVSTAAGVAGVHARLFEVCRTLRLSRRCAIVSVLLPAAAPAIIAGCRVGFSTALIMAVIAEMLGNPHGLGHAIATEQQAMQPENMFAYIVVVALLGLAMNAGFMALLARLPFAPAAQGAAHG